MNTQVCRWRMRISRVKRIYRNLYAFCISCFWTQGLQVKNEKYRAVLQKGTVELLLLSEPGDEPDQNTPEHTSTKFPVQPGCMSDISCVQLTPQFLIYGTAGGSIFYYCLDGKALPSLVTQYCHNDGGITRCAWNLSFVILLMERMHLCLFRPKFPWSIETQSKSDSIPLGTSAAIARWNTRCVPKKVCLSANSPATSAKSLIVFVLYACSSFRMISEMSGRRWEMLLHIDLLNTGLEQDLAKCFGHKTSVWRWPEIHTSLQPS